ncbi:transcriptional regulator [Mesorhizobium sp. LCM 4577]|uniref:Putative transcriptional activator n=1 Tax=Mesorhizobium plurifarium TaxID=69974 RepID=A0A090DUM2_MESPL|nr:Crp/Fnr family transcriptional regulator [Mesorhizobium sp. LCM 4577]OHV65132.1 transcriptional regulator [Mesorhizobium sp. LCM 4577]CDX18392.1 putative transcriptional activator [Mesorhizobium plurifarium]CDX44981.1 putative transcriptional activator [Mesorhizobium sp. ORS 3359]CDX52658.1 putative transcriptional activator [Mesorhizobium plurifarium]
MTLRHGLHSSGIPVYCLSCQARHRGLCSALDPDRLAKLAKTSSRHRVERGIELIGDAETLNSYSNVLSGVVKLTKSLSDGRQQIVGLRFAPDFLGQPFEAKSAIHAEAATTVSICSFPKAAIEKMMKQSPELEHRLLKQTLKELDEAREWMVTLGCKTAPEKVASFLLMIARNIDSSVGPAASSACFDLPLTRAGISDFLGITNETVSRQLTRLRMDGVIRIENSRRVTVDDMSRLEQRCGGRWPRRNRSIYET